jgi:CRP/FNR family transcriptional regulator, cyclic AMP receptor protein
MAIIGQRMYQTFAEALSECLICVMSRKDVEELLLADPQVAVRLVWALSDRLAQAEARIEEMAFKGVPARLASLLLRVATDTDWRGRRTLGGLTHQQLAELIGTHRETVTVTLNQFKAAGLLELGRRRITLLNPEGLATIAGA